MSKVLDQIGSTMKSYNERITDREKWYVEERLLRQYY